MSDKVIDASAVAALAFGDSRAGQVIDAIDGHRLHAPSLLSFELMNVAWKQLRREPATSVMVFESLADFEDMRIHVRGVDSHGVVELAHKTGLSAYDASYLWLSRYLGAPLVTLDRKLAAHAKTL